MSNSDEDDSVGYGRPPREHQFKKGTSGNPKGRKPKYENFGQIIRKVRDESVTIRLNGREVRVTAFEAAVRSTFAATVKRGNPRDLEKLIQMLEKHGVSPLAEERQKAQEGADAVMDKMLQIFDRTVEDDDHKVVARNEREKGELEIIDNCPRCKPALSARWVVEDNDESLPGDRYKTRLRTQVEDATKPPFQPYQRYPDIVRPQAKSQPTNRAPR